MKKIDIVGKRFGRLIVICYDHSVGYIPYFLCKCDCGNTKIIQKYNLIEGKTISCGCYQKERASAASKISDDRHLLKSIHGAMIRRCTNPSDRNYHSYGGRGITVCEDWLSMNAFCDWAHANGYKPGLSIERIDVNKGYNPDNCCWVEKSRQFYNLRKSVRLTYNGKTQTMAEWAKELGLPSSTLHNRIRVNGWSVERALSTPRRT